MACERSSSGKRRLLGWPRLLETRPAGPRFSKTAHRRRIWRSERPTNSAAFACVSRPSRTCRTTARRSSSLLLISTSSWATSPPFRRRHVAESGHFYLARSGHFHFAATAKGRISAVPSPPFSSLIPSSATRTRRGAATPRRAGPLGARVRRPDPGVRNGAVAAVRGVPLLLSGRLRNRGRLAARRGRRLVRAPHRRRSDRDRHQPARAIRRVSDRRCAPRLGPARRRRRGPVPQPQEHALPPSAVRLQAYAVWDALTFVLNGL